MMSADRLSSKRLAAFLMAAFVVGTAEADFEGTGFDAHYGFPAIDTPYAQGTAAPSSFVVGAGVDTVFDLEGVTDIVVDFAGSTLSIRFDTTLADPTWTTAPFNGLVFDVASGGPLTFTGALIDPSTTMAGFDAGRVGLAGDRLSIDWNGLSYVDGTRVVVDFTSPIPEPETYVLMLLGLAALRCGAGRRSVA